MEEEIFWKKSVHLQAVFFTSEVVPQEALLQRHTYARTRALRARPASSSESFASLPASKANELALLRVFIFTAPTRNEKQREISLQTTRARQHLSARRHHAGNRLFFPGAVARLTRHPLTGLPRPAAAADSSAEHSRVSGEAGRPHESLLVVRTTLCDAQRCQSPLALSIMWSGSWAGR